MTQEWIARLNELTGNGVPSVLVTVAETKGSAPREAGTKMIVTEDGQFGTIGGGNLEFCAVGEARKLLSSSSRESRTEFYPLGPSLFQCCGGTVTIFLEPFIARYKTLLLFGAGHVGREVVKVLENLPVRIKWIDERAAEFPASLPKNCEKSVTTDPLSPLKDVSAETYVLVMTHSHALDFEIVRAALKGDFAYLGMIGSESKAAGFRNRLKKSGIDDAAIKKFTSPIGIDGIDGKHPREIAISVAAELLRLGFSGR